MITLKHKSKTINIPDRWEELTPEQYLAVVAIIEDISSGNLGFFDAKLKIMQMLTGYKRSRKHYTDEEIEIINNNLVILAEKMRFIFRPEYTDPEMLEVFSVELRDELENKFPFEIFNPEMREQLAMLGNRLKYTISLKLDMRKNPIPIISYQRNKYKGPMWEIDKNNLMATDILAGEYIDALSYYRIYHQTHDEKYLYGLMAVLYRSDRSVYETLGAVARMAFFTGKMEKYKKGAFYFFQSIQEYLMQRSPYRLLYGVAPSDGGKISLGMVDSLYSLSKEGYGSTSEVAAVNLIDFLNLRMKQLIDAVKTMRASKKKVHEIADALQLPIETIQQI